MRSRTQLERNTRTKNWHSSYKREIRYEQDLTSVGGIKVVANVPRRTRIEGGYGIQYGGGDHKTDHDKASGRIIQSDNMFDDSKWHDDVEPSSCFRGIWQETRRFKPYVTQKS